MSERLKGLIKRERVSLEIDRKLHSLNLLNERPWARKLVDWGIRGIKVEPIPELIRQGESAVLVSNYASTLDLLTYEYPRGEPTLDELKPGVRALLKVASHLPPEVQFRAIGREEVITGAGLFLRALGIDKIIFPATKSGGIHRLARREDYTRIPTYVARPGHILWTSITGEPRGNGLLERDLRIGWLKLVLKARGFASEAPVWIIPMGNITEAKGGVRKATEIRFSEPLSFAAPSDLVEPEDYLLDCVRLVACHIASLLPKDGGQRGDYEDAERIIEEMQDRVRLHTIRDNRVSP
jgi:hypothetical protein